jgi:hypothetical protein
LGGWFVPIRYCKTIKNKENSGTLPSGGFFCSGNNQRGFAPKGLTRKSFLEGDNDNHEG